MKKSDLKELIKEELNRTVKRKYSSKFIKILKPENMKLHMNQ
jgi:hypothetical protein